MPEAKPAAPKGDADGAKFARALRDEQTRERPQASAPAPTRNAPKEHKTETPAREIRADKPVSPQAGKKSLAPDDDVQLPKELEDILKKSASDATPETLSLVANLLLQGGPIKDNVPVLAVLTGDFSGLSAQEVPGVVFNSPFVAKALASDGVNDFLNTETTIGDVLASLDLAPSDIAFLQQSGVNLEESVTPRQLLNAVGIDTQMLQAELQNLKGSLQLEGLRSYVERAQKIRPEVVAPAMPNTHATGSEIPVEMVSAADARASEMSSDLAMQSVGMPTTASDESVRQASDAAFVPQESAPRARLVESSPFDALGEEMNGLSKTITSAQAPEENLHAANVKGSLPQSDETTRSDERSFLSFMPTFASEAEASAAAAPTGIAALEKMLGMKASGDSAPQPMTPTVVPAESDQESPVIQNTQDSSSRLMTMDELIARLQKPEARTASDIVTAGSTGDVTAFVPVEESAADFSSSDERAGGELAQEFEPGLFQRNESASVDHVQKANFASEIMEVASPAAAPGSQEAIRHSIFEHATMMLEEGGGSIRIDLGGKDMGVLDLAVNVRDDQLDLRIIASSENVREILTQDIPRLKDSLSQQNLQLRNIEIAVSQSGAWAGQSNGGGRDPRQQFSSREDKTGEITRPASFTSRVRSYVPGVRSGSMTQAGRIQVLV